MSDKGGKTPSNDAAPGGNEPGNERRRSWIPALLVVAVIAIGVVAALLLIGGDDTNDTSAKSEVEVATTVPTLASSTAPTSALTPTAPTTALTVAPTAGPTGPTITSFTSSATSFSCTTGATFSQVTEIRLMWSTQNATGVDLSVDGAGLYGSYGPQGSAQLTVPCDGNPHTYRLTAKGSGGQTASQTISVTTTKR